MGRPKKPVPSYRHHKARDLAVVTVAGRDVYLGRYGSPESLAEYERICAEVRAASAPAAAAARSPSPTPLTVNELLVAFWEHAQAHYRRPDGTATNEQDEYRQVIRRLRPHYGLTPAAEFGPVALQGFRRLLVDAGWCRTRVNKQVGRVRRVFRWAAANELVPVAVVQALACVAGLQKGRTDARETEPVKPVPVADVLATLPHLWPTVRAMVELQRLTGMRPGEVRHLTLAEVDRSGDVWVYRPDAHKMAHAGRARAVPLGPQARAVLVGFLAGRVPDPAARLFTPANARAERFAIRRAARKSKVPPSQMNRRKPEHELKKKARDRFTDDGYAAVVRRACSRAGVEPWHPNQLRHTFASEVRRRYGLEAAQVLLGHARADVTQIYAERDESLAFRVAAEIG